MNIFANENMLGMKKIIVVLFVIFSLVGFSQNEKEIDLSNPNTTVNTHLYFLQDDSYFPEKAATTIYGYDGEEAINLAVKLKKVMDGKGLFVDFTTISNDPNYIDSTGGYENRNHFILFPQRMPSISVSKYDDKWYYSKETISEIDNLYEQTFAVKLGWLKNLVPKSWSNTSYFKIYVWQYLGLFILLALCILFFFIFKKIVFIILRKLQKRITQATNETTITALRKLARPISLLILIAIIDKVLPSLNLNLSVNTFLFLALDIAKTIFWIYVFLKIVQVAMSIYTFYVQKTHAKLDDQLVPILNIFLTGLVILLGVFRLLPLFGMDVKAVIMGASIGGLALALASQDTVKNLLGTVMIFLDKPFHIGDWIDAGGVVGTVEEVGFRSTRVRAADTSVYQIPNSQLSEIAINNKGLRTFRRYQTTLGIRYDTPPELVDAFVQGLGKLIVIHPHIKSDNYNVSFSGFGDSALEIIVNVYFEILNWGEVQSAKHHLHLAIMRLAKSLNVEFAFPSSTLYMEQFPGNKSHVIDYNIQPESIQTSIDRVVGEFEISLKEMDNEKSSGEELDD